MSRQWITVFGALLLLPLLAAGQMTKPSQNISLTAGLRAAAEETYANYNRAFQAGREKPQPEGGRHEIPSKYWAEAIKALKPLSVHLHRMNVVVVQRITDGVEEGKYILLLISSYLPQNGVDGFQFTPNPQRDNLFYAGDEVLDYKRVLKK
jgi:hypothetical protein